MTKNRRDTYKLLRALLLLIGIHTALIYVMMLVGKTSNVDMLVYNVRGFNEPPSLVWYDPQHRMSWTLFTHVQFDSFSVSADGRIAYTQPFPTDSALYVWDTRSPRTPPINITENLGIGGIPLEWSRDGRYLAFVTYRDSGSQMYIWDGESTIQLTSADDTFFPRSYPLSWSYDGRLAFVIRELSGDEEIYMWDGSETINLSQNPTAAEHWLMWSTDNQLVFMARTGNTDDIHIWDGVSTVNGVPDREAFIQVNPAPLSSYTVPTWTNAGLLVLTGFSPDSERSQIYLWDGQTATNLSHLPDVHVGNPTWSTDGRWAFTTVFAPDAVLTVRDIDNRTLLTTSGQYTPAWSADGKLVFCTPERSLNLWNGRGMFTIVEGQAISAQWQNGSRVRCV